MTAELATRLWMRMHGAGRSIVPLTCYYAVRIRSSALDRKGSKAPSIKPGERSELVTRLQRALRGYGYGIEETGSYDEATFEVVTAFQRHFRQARVDGLADASTMLTLRALLETRPTPLA